MTLQEMVREKNMTRYQLSQRSGIPWATLSDIWTGKTRLERCSGGTLVKLSGILGITVEELMALDVETSMPPDDLKAEKPYFEVNLPQDLEKSLREYIQGSRNTRGIGLPLGRMYGSINANQWGGAISKEQADYLRAKYLFEEDDEA
ncbi:MAG: helix-turn-helix domain-containing protein [Ruthenibacterium lactatiformans]|uniref:helix-turn-helix domain-containing protein n=1 Tax=Ruthenibacterium lactatiformans TaxID=1550024 RepID=UPI0039969CE2